MFPSKSARTDPALRSQVLFILAMLKSGANMGSGELMSSQLRSRPGEGPRSLSSEVDTDESSLLSQTSKVAIRRGGGSRVEKVSS